MGEDVGGDENENGKATISIAQPSQVPEEKTCRRAPVVSIRNVET